MKKNKQPLILVLYPNTYGLGFLICESPQKIIDFGIYKIRPFSKAKYLKKVEKLMDFCKPEIVLLLDYKSKVSKRQRTLLQMIKKTIKAKNLKVHSYSRSQIKEVFSSFKASTKFEIASLIIKWYPQLKRIAPHKRLPWGAEHYQMAVLDCFALMLSHNYLTE
ncbi:hypothetical protein KCTC32516_00552 [Polaribacter huanghezhanensis]|uniref:hypothetical protein n=1 Tax=Polaribacter huanghezhanensis TaxID=1354726 RepID=UPI002649F32E|nr:hypothetical protein [Polaribacter huanghezhanensis]WKD85212.1 hypothetical protein KCTC32516_00552 [Polaribacter huanghezhanensis]